jgi:hypothetical protein
MNYETPIHIVAARLGNKLGNATLLDAMLTDGLSDLGPKRGMGIALAIERG